MQAKGMQGESAKQVAIDVLRKAREPLRASEVAKRSLRRAEGQDARGHDLGDARRRVEARRPVQAGRKGHVRASAWQLLPPPPPSDQTSA
jgi:hypothetical protein